VNDSNGKPILSGRNCTGFSNYEEETYLGVDVSICSPYEFEIADAVLLKVVPFLLEDRMVERGGLFTKADAPWGVCDQFPPQCYPPS